MTNCKGVVLVVEDHPLVRMDIADAITEQGFEALEAGNAVEAIRILEARSDVRLVLTDTKMPGTMDGVELVHYIRNRWPPVKLIIVSGKTVIDLASLPAGARFFAKPYHQTKIIDAIAGMFAAAGPSGEPLVSPSCSTFRMCPGEGRRDMTCSVEEGASWAQILGPYRTPRVSRSVLELLVTAVPFVLLWGLMWVALGVGYWLCLLLALPTAFFLMRLFMIQHDCGHGACFKRRATNDWVGRVLGVVTLTPYSFWLRAHALHHANAGNLDHRGSGGDIMTLTTDEYIALNSLRRLIYRLYRNPFVLFGLIPTYLFVLQQRLPIGSMRSGIEPWLSTLGTNVAIAGVVSLLIWLMGLEPFLLVEAPVAAVSSTIAVWFFFVQHQFEHTLWAHDRDWSFHKAALNGSSHYELPSALAWFTGNIGVHHVHHLASRIPFYRLPEVLRDHPQLASVGRLTFGQSLRCATLALWDGRQKRLISFRELRRLTQAA
jgi:acyl-lipid omega-6 desaturase (Delta-12 desaturase)